MSGRVRLVGALALGGLLLVLPFVPVRVPFLFSGALSSPGTLQLIALALVFGAVALSYDLQFGITGLLTFGHALYFAAGVYTTAIAVTRWGWELPAAIALTAVVGLVLPLMLGAICLRVGGIAFAMVTLAFAQAGYIFVIRDPFRTTGGEEGLALAAGPLPDFLVGVVNTRYVYWIAVVYLALAYAAARWAVNSPPGRVWPAIRENERRVEVLGLRPYGFKLMVFVLSSFVATLGGFVYVLLVKGAHPPVVAATFTLSLLVMVVLGGAGTLWGAVLGGIVYTYLHHRLVAVSASAAVQDLPAALRVPLSEPQFILGAIFVLVVMFFPGGIAGLATRGRRRTGLQLLAGAVKGAEDVPGAPGEGAEARA